MATKSKKSKAYLLRWKVIGVLLFFIFASGIFFCGIMAMNISKVWSSDAINADSVYETDEFRLAFDEILDHMVLAEVHYQSQERIEAGETVDREEMLSSFRRYYNVTDGIITGNTRVNDTFDGLEIYGNIPEGMQDNLLEYQELVESRLPSYYRMYIQRQLDEYKSSTRYLEDTENFLYYIEDEAGNIIGGNASIGEVTAEQRTLVLSAGLSSNHLGNGSTFYNGYENPILEGSSYQCFCAIRDPLLPGDGFYDMGQDFSYAKASMPILFGVFSLAMVGLIVCLIHLIRVAGQKEKGGEVTFLLVDRIYNEIHFLLVFLAGFLSINLAGILIVLIMNGTVTFWNYVFGTMLGALYLASAGIGLSYVLSVARQVKNRSFFRNTWIAASIRRMSALFTGKTFRGWMVIVMMFYGLGNCVLMGGMIVSYSYGSLREAALFGLGLLVFNLLCMYLFLRALRSLKEIMISAKENSKGNFSYQLNLDRISPSFLNFAKDVANIQEGLKNAVDDAVKGERMKAELITNVSHDLKTPLTSIISYVDLLKQEKLENETASAYVDILHEKSYRLKQLIEDLIEASKASSGNLSVQKMRVDYKQLTLQAMGEMEDKTEAAGLTFKVSCPEPVYIDADGGHMWRILENLLSNIVKYAMPNSRVYIDILKMDNNGLLIIKNMSAAPIDFDETRLTDRFVRGDASRTTEGSGLGLSITQSLTELQGGSFGIQVDGDLFKTIVSIPLYMEETEADEEEMEE
ncbi:MAG: HAMP domain-containing sensor histidine kinase [Bacillota bacterium]|nr:HAMP domain-containing sensor histidine kinase [Bacillota bacterium]